MAVPQSLANHVFAGISGTIYCKPFTIGIASFSFALLLQSTPTDTQFLINVYGILVVKRIL